MAIKIPKQVYVGFQGRRSEDEVPLGFMTPHTTDAAGVKRKDSVDRWASGSYRSTKKFNSVTLDNSPMIGFKIGRAIRRSGSWNGSGASYIRIEDPRGFELEITIENLAMCMVDNIIENGEIMQECVWGRDGSRNILLPTTCDLYKDSIEFLPADMPTIPLKTIKVGDTVKTKAGNVGIYMGVMYPVISYHGVKPTIGNKQYVLKSISKTGKVSLYVSSSIKITEIIETVETKLTPLEIEKSVNDDIGNSNIVSNNYIKLLLTQPVEIEQVLTAISQPTAMYHLTGIMVQIKNDELYPAKSLGTRTCLPLSPMVVRVNLGNYYQDKEFPLTEVEAWYSVSWTVLTTRNLTYSF